MKNSEVPIGTGHRRSSVQVPGSRWWLIELILRLKSFFEFLFQATLTLLLVKKDFLEHLVAFFFACLLSCKGFFQGKAFFLAAALQDQSGLRVHQKCSLAARTYNLNPLTFGHATYCNN